MTWRENRGGGVGETIYSSHESVAIADLMLQKFVWLNLSTPVIWKTFNIACHFRNGPLKSWKWENNKSQSLAGEYSRENKVSRLKGCFISSLYGRFSVRGQFFFFFKMEITIKLEHTVSINKLSAIPQIWTKWTKWVFPPLPSQADPAIGHTSQ